ncbi:MAG: phage tail tape measure protein [Flavobacteriaceae bacterium]
MADINIRIGANISELDKALKGAERNLRRSGAKFKAIGGDLTASLSVPFAAFAGFSLKAAGDFEQSMNNVRAVTAGAEVSFEALREKAKELGSTTAFSASQSADAIEMLGRNGLRAEQILGGAAEAAIKLAEATGGDLSLSADIATDAMAQFGIEASDMLKVVDLIAGTTSNSKFSLEDFQYAMASAGGVAGAVGVEFEDFTTAVAAISPAFASGGDAGTSLKTFLTNLIPVSTSAADEMKRLGIITKEGANRFFDAQGNMKSMSDISGVLKETLGGLSEEQLNMATKTIFGTDAMRAGIMLAQTGAADFDKLAESIGGVSATEMAATRMEGFNGSMKRMQSAFEALQIAFAESGLLNMMTNFIESITGVFISLSQTNPAIFNLVTIIGLVVAAIGPMLMLVGQSKVAFAAMAGGGRLLLSVLASLNNGVAVLMATNIKSLIVDKAKAVAIQTQTAVLTAYNAIVRLSNNIVNAFKISTIKATAALIAQRAAIVAKNVALAIATGLVNAYIAAETAYIAVKKVLTKQIKLASIAQRAFNIVLIANPIGIVVAALGALVIGIVAAYQNVDWFRKLVDGALNFIRKKFMWLIDGVSYVFKNFPAILNAAWKALSQFVTNMTVRLKSLAMSAEQFRLKFTRALTINKETRAELTKSINKLGDQKNNLKKQAKKIGAVFNESLSEELKKVDAIKVPSPQIENNPSTSSPTPSAAPSVSGGGVSAIERVTQAVEAQKTAVLNLAGAQELQSKAMANSLAPMGAYSEGLEGLNLKQAKLNAAWKALSQFVTNMTVRLKSLAMSAEQFRLKFTRALTINKETRAELTKSINKLGDQKNNLKKQAKKIGAVFNESLSEELKKVGAIKVPSPQIENNPSTSSPTPSAAPSVSGGGVSAIEGVTQAVEAQKTAVSNLASAQELQSKAMANSLSPMGAYSEGLEELKLKQAELTDAQVRLKEGLASFNEGLTQIVEQGLGDLAVGFGEAVGMFAAGGMTLQQVGGTMVGQLADILGQVGKLAISTGIATIGIKAALKSLNPLGAIAGGTALVALSKFVKSKMSSVTPLADGGILTKPVFSQGFLAGEAGPEAVIPLNRLDSMLSGGGNGGSQKVVVEGVIRGNDLMLVHQRQSRIDGRLR